MLMEAKNNIKLIAMYFKFNLSALMEYRGSFLTQVLGMFINNSSFIFFWWVLFESVKTIGGYGFQEVMMIWAISSMAYGLCFAFFGNARRISLIILNGELDPYLLQPKNVLVNLIASGSVMSAWGDILYGLTLFIVVNGLSGLAPFLLFSFTGALVLCSAIVLAGSLTFFMGDSRGVVDLIMEFVVSFSIYPEGIYQGFTKPIIYSLIPAAYISFVPIRLIQSFTWKWLLILFIAVSVWICLSYFIFMRGLKRYESGNLIINKL